MNRTRVVAAEELDALAADHPAARQARRDLRRIHRAMGTRSLILRHWRRMLPARDAARPVRVLELGAGDGTLLLGVARVLGAAQAPVALTLIDRQDLLDQATMDAYRRVGWTAEARVADVFEWADGAAAEALPPGAPGQRWDLILANLFLHHFAAAQLAPLLQAVASRSACFLALEPRRSAFALAASHLVGALGANQVTRNDSVLSVRAGFRARELTALWPARDGSWTLHEGAAGLFSHGFLAQRSGAG